MNNLPTTRLSLRSSAYTLCAAAGTALAWIAVESRAGFEAAYFDNYGIDPAQVRLYFLWSLGLLLVAMPFEGGIRRWLAARPRVQLALIVLASVVSASVMALLGRDEVYRTFRFPFGLWILIVQVVGLCALTIALVVSLREDQSLPRLALALVLVPGILLALVHIASLGEFMTLDLPDEPWLSSMATNYALHNQLSPSYIASVFGTPDPGLPRYFLAMGLWLKAVGSTTIQALRAFPLLVGILAAGLSAYVLLRQRRLNRIQVLAGTYRADRSERFCAKLA